MTSGRGSFEAHFDHYDEVPGPIAEKVIRDTRMAHETAKAAHT
jgi:translation elongation factor EF-G